MTCVILYIDITAFRSGRSPS